MLPYKSVVLESFHNAQCAAVLLLWGTLASYEQRDG